MRLSAYRVAYCLVMFDLPTTTAQEKHDYVRFRRLLLQDGFMMLQWSVYARHCHSVEAFEGHAARVRRNLPPAGEVRILRMTDAQFRRMEIFRKRKRAKNEPPPGQLVFL